MSKTVWITGASSGIGREFARRYARLGFRLILTARRTDRLEALAAELTAKHSTFCRILPADLEQESECARLCEALTDERIDIFINNAGFGVFGKFSETALQEELELLQVNVRALHILTKLFLRDFKKRNFGKILNVASSAGFLTGPLFSSYYASKNYVVRLSLAIAEELRREKSRVTISILCPGPVDTGFNDRAGVQFRVKALTPEAVAKEAVFGLLTGKLLIIPGLMMRVGVAASKLVPEKLLSRILYHVQAAKQPEHK